MGLSRFRWSAAGWLAATLAFGALSVAAVSAATAGMAPVAAWNLAFTAAALCALGGMLAALNSAGEEDRTRWAWWTVGAGVWVCGQLAWNVASIEESVVAAFAADVGWYAFALIIIGSVLRERSRALRIVAVLEVVPLVVAVLALVATLLWGDVAASSLSIERRFLALAYPVVYVSAAVVMLQAVVGGSLRPIRGMGSRVVLAGMATEAVAFILWGEQLLGGTYVPGETAVDHLWVAGLLMMATGGVVEMRSGPRVAQPAKAPERWGGILPGVTFALLVAALIRAQLTYATHEVLIALTVGLLTCGVSLFVRAMLLERRLLTLLTRERLARHELAGSRAELALLNDRLREDVRCDPLTGLHNRRALADDLPAIESHAIRHGEPFAVALCDIDHFKAYNDALGHIAGDDALREVAATIRGLLRAGDVAYRYGGEEFLLLLRGTDLRAAELIAQRIRVTLAESGLEHPAAPSGIVTASLGVAAGASDAATLIEQADAALYEAKRGGRDRVMVARAGQVAATRARSAIPVDDPVVRHLLSLLGVARAGAGREGPLPVLEALAECLQSELRFQTVVINLRDADGGRLHVALVRGEQAARAALEGTSSAWSNWEPLLVPAHDRSGACWLPAGSVEWDDDDHAWVPPPNALVGADAWKPDDMLLLPLRDHSGEVIGLVSVDEPLTGRRPDDAQIALLMAVADHASVALAHAIRDHGGVALETA